MKGAEIGVVRKIDPPSGKLVWLSELQDSSVQSAMEILLFYFGLFFLFENFQMIPFKVYSFLKIIVKGNGTFV